MILEMRICFYTKKDKLKTVNVFWAFEIRLWPLAVRFWLMILEMRICFYTKKDKLKTVNVFSVIEILPMANS
jgi:hypothetical protein